MVAFFINSYLLFAFHNVFSYDTVCQYGSFDFLNSFILIRYKSESFNEKIYKRWYNISNRETFIKLSICYEKDIKIYP